MQSWSCLYAKSAVQSGDNEASDVGDQTDVIIGRVEMPLRLDNKAVRRALRIV